MLNILNLGKKLVINTTILSIELLILLFEAITYVFTPVAKSLCSISKKIKYKA
ncbi:MAG: hypothetical protein P8H39_01100 [Thalassotalea sp.]|nr:hypothetical protein [Thalassotalea sp.]